MSNVDEFDLNRRYHLVLMETMDIADAGRQEKTLNSSPSLSPRQLQSLLNLFNLNDVQRRDLNNLENIWGVFQGIRRDRESRELIRDQISIVINVGADRTARIYIRPVRDLREQVLPELEAVRNPGQLFQLLGDLTSPEISRRPARKFDGDNRGPKKDFGGRGKQYGQKKEGSNHKPFQGLDQRMRRDSQHA